MSVGRGRIPYFNVVAALDQESSFVVDDAILSGHGAR
jgi:hypothetical protein